MAVTKKIALKNAEEHPTEILAEAIVRIGDSVAKLNKNGLNRKAIVVLLQDATKLPQRDIKTVLDALPELERMYCR